MSNESTAQDDDETIRLRALRVLQTALPIHHVGMARCIENEIFTAADICDRVDYVSKIKQITFDLYKNPKLLDQVQSVTQLIALPTKYTRRGTSVNEWYIQQERQDKSTKKMYKKITTKTSN